jgi:hypothetical protein
MNDFQLGETASSKYVKKVKIIVDLTSWCNGVYQLACFLSVLPIDCVYMDFWL